MKKLSVITILALLLALILGSTVVYAAIHWCPDDPVLSIDGTEVNVLIEIGPEGEEAPEDLVKGPVHVKVYVPSNVEAEVIELGDGFNNQGERVTIISNKEAVGPEDPISVKVEVKVQTEDAKGFPVRVTIEAAGLSESTEGWSNTWVECEVEL